MTDIEKFHALVDSHDWHFAKTYAAFCPHEYTLRREGWSTEDFRWFVRFIWDNGFDARMGKYVKRYFIDPSREWYYFVVPEDFDERGEVKFSVFGVNRGSLKEFEFVESGDLFGSEIVVKRLPKERRGI